MSANQSNEMLNAKEKEAKCIGSRAAKRIDQIIISINKINNEFESSSKHNFQINERTKRNMVSNLMQFISLWDGGANRNTNTNTNNAKLYLKVRTYWNHKKAEKLGDHLFCVILSILFQHLMSTPQKSQLIVFIDIFCGLLNETIRFPRTKALPLICCASFIKANKFKDFCVSFLEYFGAKIHYGRPRMTKTARVNGKSQTKYIRDRGRAKKQKESYAQCLRLLRQQLIASTNDRFLQHSIRRFHQWILDHNTSDSVPPTVKPLGKSHVLAPTPSQGTETEQKTNIRTYNHNAMMPRAVSPMRVPRRRVFPQYPYRPYAYNRVCCCNGYPYYNAINAFNNVHIDPNAMRRQLAVHPIYSTHAVPHDVHVPVEHSDTNMDDDDRSCSQNESDFFERLSPNSFMMEMDEDETENILLDVLIDMHNGV
eukprot:122130_1